MNGDPNISRVPHAGLLLELVETVLAEDGSGSETARHRINEILGPAALVDAAGIIASFHAIVKVADATGIPLENAKAQATADLREQLGINRFDHRNLSGQRAE